MRSLVFVAVVLSLLSHGFAQQPVLPPGPPQPITPPVVVPTPAPAVDPHPDALEDKFAIVCTIGGEIIGDEIVSLAPGRMLTLTLQGTPKDSQPAVTWALNKESKDISIYPVDGHHVTFTANDGVWLFTAAINNPDAAKAPLLAQRWVVVNGPQPPPVVVPDKPVDPKPPVVTPTKATAVTYVYEKNDTAVPNGVRVALNTLNRENKVVATEFEQNSFDGHDEIPDQYKAALTAAKEAGLPALVVLADSTVLNVVKSPKTEQAVLEAVR